VFTFADTSVMTMAPWMSDRVVISCFICVIISAVNLRSLADEDTDHQRDINDPQPFRLNKLNVMWTKAKKVHETFNILYFAIWRGDL